MNRAMCPVTLGLLEQVRRLRKGVARAGTAHRKILFICCPARGLGDVKLDPKGWIRAIPATLSRRICRDRRTRVSGGLAKDFLCRYQACQVLLWRRLLGTTSGPGLLIPTS